MPNENIKCDFDSKNENEPALPKTELDKGGKFSIVRAQTRKTTKYRRNM